MADKKISQLTALAAANLAPSTDVLAIVDTSATETKKIAAQDIVNGVLNVASAVGIGTTSPGATLDVAGNARSNAWIGRANGSAPTADAAIYRAADNTLGFSTANTERARIDSSGNLGLGVTPSAWGSPFGSGVLEISGGYFAGSSSSNVIRLSSNNYYSGANYIYKTSSEAAAYVQSSGQHQWFIAPSGTAGNAITGANAFVQTMTLDASGRLGIGTTSPTQRLHLAGSGDTMMLVNDGTYNSFFGTISSQTRVSNDNAIPIVFATNSTERGRFTAGGYFKASNAGTYAGSTSSYHELRSSAADTIAYIANSHATTPYGIYLDFSAATPDNNSQWFLYAEDATAARCYIYSDGDLANHDGVYGTISDERLKQDIVDASSQWDDLKAIRFRKYRMKTDVEANPDAPAMFGVVAQELAQVCPGLVDEHPNMKTVEVTDEEGNVTQTQEPDGTTTMTVKSSILLMKAAKALQEAMARIEQLEADMAALKASA